MIKKIVIADRMMENSKMVNGSKKVVNILNRYFVRKAPNIINNLPNININPMTYYKKYVQKKKNTFYLKQINMSELRSILSNINKSKSFDYYGLSMDMILRLRRSLEPILLNLVNISIYNSNFPDILKISKIIPIPKSNNYLDPSNFRPINILCPISKILEKNMSIQITKYLKNEKYVSNNHQGGMSNRGTAIATLNINMKINQILERKNLAAVIAMDQSACFEIIDHGILLEKMEHIGFNPQTIRYIADFLNNRKQYVENNSNSSDLLLLGNQSVIQGSSLSCIFYNIFTLDLPFITHAQIHESHYEYFSCNQTFICAYIDDCFGIIEGKDDDIWQKIHVYIETMKKYYNANKLKINVIKTKIMITGDNKNIVGGNIILENETIYNLPNIRILGTLYSDNAKFNDNVILGPNSFITQLKRRSNVLIRICKYYNPRFRAQLIDSILIGKIRYNITTWGNIGVTLKSRLNRIISKTVDLSTNDIWFGKSLKWKMKNLNIDNFFDTQRKSCLKLTYQLLNNNDGNAASILLSKDRSIRFHAENKCGPSIDNMGWTYISQNSFIYQMRTQYNGLPRNLTLSRSKTSFKKWLDFYMVMTEFQRLPVRQDNTYFTHTINISQANIISCQTVIN